jgi:hypothetical protein
VVLTQGLGTTKSLTFAFGEGQSCEDGEHGHREEEHLGLHGCFSSQGSVASYTTCSRRARSCLAICMMLMGWNGGLFIGAEHRQR